MARAVEIPQKAVYTSNPHMGCAAAESGVPRY